MISDELAIIQHETASMAQVYCKEERWEKSLIDCFFFDTGQEIKNSGDDSDATQKRAGEGANVLLIDKS